MTLVIFKNNIVIYDHHFTPALVYFANSQGLNIHLGMTKLY